MYGISTAFPAALREVDPRIRGRKGVCCTGRNVVARWVDAVFSVFSEHDPRVRAVFFNAGIHPRHATTPPFCH